MTDTFRTAALLSALALAACGGGSSSPPPTAATLRLSISGLPASAALAGAEVRLRLPQGVTPRLAAGQPAAGAVVLAAPLTAASAELLPPAWDAGARTLRFAVASKAPGGLAPGALAEVECDVSAAAGPPASGYQVADFTAADLSVRPVAGATLVVAPSYR